MLLQWSTEDNLQHFLVSYKANRFHIAMPLFSSRTQMTSKCGTFGTVILKHDKWEIIFGTTFV